jgi:tetratricopeptide (TPR) repeat protein
MRSAAILVCLYCFACLSTPLHSQVRVEESYVNLQKALIDANREKLLGNYDKALAILESLRKEKREEDVLLYEMARVYAEKGELEKGADLLRDAIRINPENPWYIETLAFYLERLGRLSEAAERYGTLRTMFPREKRYYFSQAALLLASGEGEGAIKAYEAWEKVVGRQSETLLLKYELYAAAGETKKAVRELETLIALSPSNISYRHLLAAYLLDVKDDKGAIEVFTDILRLDPNDAKAQMALAANRAASGNPATGDDLMELMPLFEKNDISIDAKLARIIPRIEQVANTGDKDLADRLLQLTAALERVHPKDAKGYAASGDLFFHTGQFGEARSRYEKTLSLDDRNFMVWENLFFALEATSDWPALLQQTELAMDVFPNRGTVFLLNGVAAYKLGRYADAQDVLEQATLMFSFDKPQLLRTLLTQGKVLQAMNEPEEAQLVFGEAAKLAPEDPLALHAGAMWFYREGDHEEALRWMEQSLEFGGDKSAMILEHFGDVLYRLERVDDALSYWVKAQKLGKGASKWLSKKIADKKLYE